MIKLLILLLIIAGAFWLGRISAGSKKEKVTEKSTHKDPTVIDIEVEDES